MRQLLIPALFITSLGLGLPAMAAESSQTDRVHQAQHTHFLGKRPYQPTMLAKADAEQAWVGATLRADSLNQQQTMKLHALGKRAF